LGVDNVYILWYYIDRLDTDIEETEMADTTEILGTYRGIKVEYAVMIDIYVVRVYGPIRGGYRMVAKAQGGENAANEKFDTLDEARARGFETLAQQPMRSGYTEVRAWFADGGTTYAASYPGKDVLGIQFEKGATIIRKHRQNLAV